ncbi:DUF1801 domain-containing protein [Flavobacteriaceae bacterium R38]|nr:DUF1801 domain-containing protein [Flavobacteriaceae bacterium R38]
MQFDKDIQSKNKDLFLKIRDLLLSNPGITEIKKEDITTYSYNKSGVCHIKTMPYGVAISFLKGSKLNDIFHLLHDNRESVKTLSLKGYNKAVINHFVKQAIEINKNESLNFNY